MALDYTADDLAFMDEVRDWFVTNTPSHLAGDAFMFGTMSPADNVAWCRKLHARGWAAINWPKAYGGTDWSQRRKHMFEMVRAETRAPMGYNMGVNLLGPVIYGFGTEAQKSHYLPRILNYDDWWCQGYSEPGAGSDLASLKTRAVPDGDHYLVNGTKIWTTYAHLASKIFCLVRTSTAGKKQQGISFLLIDLDTAGIEIRPIVSIDGRHHLNQVFFTDVRVPRANLVGEEGQGWSIAKYLLTHERTNIARIPLSKVALAKLKELAARPSGAGVIADHEHIAERIAEVELDLKCLEFTNAQMLERTDAGQAPGVESSLLKIKGTEIQQRLAQLRLEVAGYEAYPWQAGPATAQPALMDSGHQALDAADRALLQAAAEYNFSRASTIYGGSNEVQYNVMAKGLLGLWSMAIDLTEEQQLLKASAERFVERDYAFAQRQTIVASEAGFSRALWAQFAELGWLGAGLPEAVGGYGGGAVEHMVIAQALGRAMALEPFVSTAVAGAHALTLAANRDLAEPLLARLVAGELLLGLAVSERQARYDLHHVATRAAVAGNRVLLNGAKIAVLDGASADYLVVAARVSGALRDRDGIALALVAADAPGVTRRSYRTMDGTSAADVVFSDCEAELLVAEDAGFAVLEQVLERAVVARAAQAVGAMEASFQQTVAYVKTREQFGVPIGSFQVLQHRLVDMLIAVHECQSMVLMAAGEVMSDDPAMRRAAAAGAKAFVGKRATRLGQEIVQMHGGIGMTEELAIGHYFRYLTQFTSSYGSTAHHLARFTALTAG